MTELQDCYKEILQNIQEIQQEYKNSNQKDQKFLTKIDRKAKKIEQAISSYELDINNTIGPDEEIQIHNQQLQDLQLKYQNLINAMNQNQSQIRANPNFGSVLSEINQNNGSYINQGPQDIQLELTNNTNNNIQKNKSSMASQKISLQPQQQFQDQQNINVPMQSTYQNNDQTQNNMMTDINYQNGLINNQQNVQSLQDLKCAVKGCFQKVDIQCYKCKVWICRGHFYKDAEYKKNVHKLEEQGIDIVTRIRLYCKDCGLKKDRKFKEYRWIIGCCFCSMIVIAIMIAFMTYLEFL